MTPRLPRSKPTPSNCWRSWSTLSSCWSRPCSEIGLILGIAAFGALAPVLTRLRLDRLDRLLGPGRPGPPPSAARMAGIAGLVDRVLARGQPFLRSGCLVRGLTRYYFLRRAGARVSLCFGIAWADQEVAGHCWLEADGAPIFEPNDPRPRFIEMYRLPS